MAGKIAVGLGPADHCRGRSPVGCRMRLGSKVRVQRLRFPTKPNIRGSPRRVCSSYALTPRQGQGFGCDGADNVMFGGELPVMFGQMCRMECAPRFGPWSALRAVRIEQVSMAVDDRAVIERGNRHSDVYVRGWVRRLRNGMVRDPHWKCLAQPCRYTAWVWVYSYKPCLPSAPPMPDLRTPAWKPCMASKFSRLT